MNTENTNRQVYEELWKPQMVNFKTTGPGSRWMFNLMDDMIGGGLIRISLKA